jgi:hypothetical protein
MQLPINLEPPRVERRRADHVGDLGGGEIRRRKVVAES